MFSVGVTGGIATGKSTVAKMLAAFGGEIFDADQVAHSLLLPQGECFAAVSKMFGVEIIKNGQIDRSKLSRCVFADEEQRKRLESVIHPVVKRKFSETVRRLEREDRGMYLVADIPLLFEAHLHRYVDWTVVVTALRYQQLERASRTLKISQYQTAKRIKAQMPLKDKIRMADFIIDNSGNIQQTKNQVKNVWEEIQKKTQK